MPRPLRAEYSRATRGSKTHAQKGPRECRSQACDWEKAESLKAGEGSGFPQGRLSRGAGEAGKRIWSLGQVGLGSRQRLPLPGRVALDDLFSLSGS